MKKTKLQRIKYVIKITIITVLLMAFVILGFFVKHTYTYENSSLKKWQFLSEQQRIDTLNRIVQNPQDSTLLIQCVSKISQLPDSETMDIRDAVVLCYNGIKLNTDSDEE